MPLSAGPLAMLWPWRLTFWLKKLKHSLILVPKCVNAESLIKFSPVALIYHINKAKECIFQHVGRTVTLNFDLLIPKLEAFILVPKCTNAESLVKICPTLFNTLHGLTTFWTHEETHRLTYRLRTARKHVSDRTLWRRHKNSISILLLIC